MQLILFYCIALLCIKLTHCQMKIQFTVLITTAALLFPGSICEKKFAPDEIYKANTAAYTKYLSYDEKEVIKFMNLARLDGKRFYHCFIDSFIRFYNATYTDKINSDNSYVRSLKNALYEIKNLALLLPDSGLYVAAKYHAADMGKKGLTGHNSSDNTPFPQRLKNISNITSPFISENCSYGIAEPLFIVCDLLIDNNVPSLGHRKNILNPQFVKAGVSIQLHSSYRVNCVIDYSD